MNIDIQVSVESKHLAVGAQGGAWRGMHGALQLARNIECR